MTWTWRGVACDGADTARLAARLAPVLRAGDVVYLLGDLGAGKTTFARGLIQALQPGVRVKSPTYTLVERYDTPGLRILHLDLYRVADPNELEFLGVREELGAAAVVVEWPARGAGLLPPADLEIRLEPVAAGREISARSLSDAGQRLMAALAADLDGT